jgi:hypothetical protein
VRFYLAIIVEGAAEVVVVFPVCFLLCECTSGVLICGCSTFFRSARSSRRFGEALESVSMMVATEPEVMRFDPQN